MSNEDRGKHFFSPRWGALMRTLVFGLAALAAGCGGEGRDGVPSPVAADTSSVEQSDLPGSRFRCGDALVVLRRVADDAADLQIGAVSYRMQREPTASGVKYVATGTEPVSFWDKGDRALLSMAGEQLTECRREGAGAMTPAAVDPGIIIGTTWVLEDLNRSGIIDSSHLTLSLAADGSLSGSGGCNQFRGQYALSDAGLEVAPNIASTRKACAAAIMNQEQEYLRLLPGIREIRIDQTGALILSNPDGAELLFRAQG